MQSNKPTRKSSKQIENLSAPVVEVQPVVTEEAKSRKKTTSKPSSDATSAAKSHRRPTKQAASAAIHPVAVGEKPVAAVPSGEEIERLAYSYWVERGYQGGCPTEDWLRAERQLLGA